MSPGKLESHVRTSEPLGSYSLKLKFMKPKLICGLVMLHVLLGAVHASQEPPPGEDETPPTVTVDANESDSIGSDQSVTHKLNPKPDDFDKMDNFRGKTECQEYIKRMLDAGNTVPCKGWCVKVIRHKNAWCRCRSTKQTQKTGEECGEWQACRIIKLNGDDETYTVEWKKSTKTGKCEYSQESKPFKATDLQGLYYERGRDQYRKPAPKTAKQRLRDLACGADNTEGCSCSCFCHQLGECLKCLCCWCGCDVSKD